MGRKFGDARIVQRRLVGLYIRGISVSYLMLMICRWVDVSRDLGWELVLI
jgi:hypothetical protein